MKREIENRICKWIDSSNKALLIEGVRQSGKTYIIRKVLNDNHINYFEINFLERSDIREALAKIDDAEEFVEKLMLLSKKVLNRGKDYIFLDEVQEFPEIITKIKFLVEEGSFKYVLSGSLLGVELKGIKSIPVGYMERLKMYPMNFIEFLKALEVSDRTIDHIEDCFKKKKPVDEIVNKKLLNLFDMYLIVGGMPEVVKKFVETKNLLEVDSECKNIKDMYRFDFTKYESLDKRLKIISIYDNIASQLNKQNLRFVFSYLNKELKFDRYENSFLWLKDAGVAYPVYNVSNMESPLVMAKEKNNFKLFMSDTGLLTSSYPYYVKENILLGKDDYNKGALYENYACCELKANDLDVYYIKNSTVGEVDFLVEIDGTINAIEIKSGKYYRSHKALENLGKYNNIRRIVFSRNNVENGDILYLPIYMIGFLKNRDAEDMVLKLDLEGI